MAVVIVHQGPGLTRESYEEAVRRLTGKARLESPADWPAEGLLVHTAGEAEGGFRIVDVWESKEAVQRFGETLMPDHAGARRRGPAGDLPGAHVRLGLSARRLTALGSRPRGYANICS